MNTGHRDRCGAGKLRPSRRRGSWRFLLAAVAVVGVATGGGALADVITAGFDYWATSEEGTYVEFGGATPNPPLPIDFFGPGSDPFDGVVAFEGDPIDPGPLLEVSTIVERVVDLDLSPPYPTSGTVEIQIIQLQLRSVEPITVTHYWPEGEPDSFFDVYVHLPELGPASTGQMTIRQDTEFGGMYGEVWCYIYPQFDFVEVGTGTTYTLIPPDPYLMEALGPGEMGYPWQIMPPIAPTFPNQGPNFFPMDPMPDLKLYWPWPDYPQIGAHPSVPFVSCCLPDLTCVTTTAADCWLRGGWQVPVCRGDGDGNGKDDACEIVPPDFHASPIDESWVNFGTDLVPPIPADFFEPGSDPFEGQVALKGRPIDPDVLGGTSTILQRADDPVLPGEAAGTEGTVDLQIVALSLVSTAPITVTYDGISPEDWGVSVALSEVPAPAGWLTATKTHANGGTFDSMIYVQPVFVFTREGDGAIRVLDLGLEGNPALEMYTTGQPFVHAVYEDLEIYYDSEAQWIAGVDEVTHGDPSTQEAVLFLVATQDGPVASVGHGVIPPPPPPPPPIVKWEQLPDLTPFGMDVYAQGIPDPGVVLADDFECRVTGPITQIEVWGSWLWDEVPGDPANVTFILSIHADIPQGPHGWSIPENPPLWMHVFAPGEFDVSLYAQGLEEGWYDPSTGYYEPFADTMCWLYTFPIPEGARFFQLGTPDDPIIYWLDVQALPEYESYFGWKTSLMHWNDDAVWGEGPDPPPDWWELRYPQGHPFVGESIDLAFRITGREEELDGACCYDDDYALCIETTQDDCEVNLGGVYEGDGVSCAGMEACCAPIRGTGCVDADALCCVNELGGTPQGPGTACMADQACCLPNGFCLMIDPQCCDELSGVAQGLGSVCTAPEACCLKTGACIEVDPLCCDEMGGTLPGEPNCLGDGNGNGMDDACEPDGLKWVQMPDLEPTGIDVEAMLWPPGGGILLADDFECTETGLISEIKVWGSWYNDFVWPDAGTVRFTLSIHADNPEGPGGYSEPVDPPLWIRTFEPGEFFYEAYMFGLVEGFYEAWPAPGFYDPTGDTICWLYTFPIPEGQEFLQTGSPGEPVVYWLDVQADTVGAGGEGAFGWKTSLNHWNDDAVWAYGTEAGHDLWQELIYPEQHPMHPESIDLAFMLISRGAANPPAPCEEYPNNFPMNRFLCFDPNNPTTPVAFEFELMDTGPAVCYVNDPTADVGATWWVTQPECTDCNGVVGPPPCVYGPPDYRVWRSQLTTLPQPPRLWLESPVFIGDCEIIPIATYVGRATSSPPGGPFSANEAFYTIRQPAPKCWGDVVGIWDGAMWTPPNTVVNMDDVMAAVFFFQHKPNEPHKLWVELADQGPDMVVNMTDIQMIVKAFKNDPYPYENPGACP